MIKSVRIELDREGVGELLRGPEVTRDLERRGRDVAAAAGGRRLMVSGVPGDVPLPITTTTRVTTRARVVVVIDHPSGMAVEAKHRLLVGSLDAAR